MRTLLCALVAPILLVAWSCSGSTASRATIVTDARDIRICCDPDDEFPLDVSRFRIQMFQGQFSHLDEATVSAVFTSTISNELVSAGQLHTTEPPIHLSLASDDPLELGSNEIGVFVDNCDFTRVQVEFLAEVVGRRLDDRSLEVTRLRHTFSVINSCPPSTPPPSQPQLLVETILGTQIADFDPYGVDTPVGVPTLNSSSDVAPQVPIWAFTETFQVGWVVADLDQQQLDDAFVGAEPSFPLGTGNFGLTIQAQQPAPMMPGRYLLAWQCVLEDLPVDDAIEKQLRYGFVVDRDDDPTNNYVGQPPLDNDPFNDTDTWFVAEARPFVGWFLTAFDVQAFPPIPVASSARVIIYQQVQLYVIPVTELGTANPLPSRFTTFAHEGDSGLFGGPWSGDQSAPIDEPLLSIGLDPDF